MNNEITLDSYKGSNIEKGFTNKTLSEASLIMDVVDTFNKGLIEEDVFEKAIEEINILKGIASVGTHMTADNGWKIEKGENGWAIEKGEKDESEDDDEDEEETEVEKGILDKTFKQPDDEIKKDEGDDVEGKEDKEEEEKK